MSCNDEKMIDRITLSSYSIQNNDQVNLFVKLSIPRRYSKWKKWQHWPNKKQTICIKRLIYLIYKFIHKDQIFLKFIIIHTFWDFLNLIPTLVNSLVFDLIFTRYPSFTT